MVTGLRDCGVIELLRNGAEDPQPEFLLVSIWCLYTAEIRSIQVPMVKISTDSETHLTLIYPRNNGILLMTRAV